MCPSMQLATNYTNHEKKVAVRYTFIDEHFEITSCKFLQVSMTNDEGAAISIQKPAYKYLNSQPFIKINNIFLWQCQSELTAGGIYIEYEYSHIDVSHVCSIDTIGYYCHFCHFGSRNPIFFNTSSVSSNFNISQSFSYYIYRINENDYMNFVNSTFITGINTSSYFVTAAEIMAIHADIKYCQKENIVSAIFIALHNSNLTYCNYKNVTSYDINDRSFNNSLDVIKQVKFMHCVFIDSTVYDYLKAYIDKRHITFEDCSGTQMYDVKPYLLPVCREPDNKKNLKMIIYYSVSISLFFLLLTIVIYKYYNSLFLLQKKTCRLFEKNGVRKTIRYRLWIRNKHIILIKCFFFLFIKDIIPQIFKFV
ncbi:hypothetical protein TVAG_204790 [Trichomonas vaginalis G3]|uniref:Uncharacterized protein n=1 Tax=Trichomonas vaginalis (strain ATCC PRA-98 / G3) TaxID=412133 RepID=A2EIY3_TRIV3|nr:hypothetical protein TVAGG3_0661530 [Trichomonas vaginalis G3]EAY07373.1 hypothetical protein TVAG_204790 [Trichomonas vaginalis G3]KAI5506526.1 hypothetical protein TVAGG3_0661530 [Trichomonas vaginalis G3]|eukprot:XP_001319596.1 hypothetical protein [Trichomonas vaginalis G3]